MRIVSQTRRSRHQRTLAGRAATMIEFALVLPIFLFMMLLSLDLGTLMLTSGAMNDTAFSAARAGAQAGGGGMDGSTPSCPSNGFCSSGIAYETAEDGMAQMPMGDVVYDYDSSRFQVTSGAVCVDGGDNTFVTVVMPYTVNTYTPGLAALVGALNGTDGEWEMQAVGVARCETYRTTF